jgi:hypothetical protein
MSEMTGTECSGSLGSRLGGLDGEAQRENGKAELGQIIELYKESPIARRLYCR